MSNHESTVTQASKGDRSYTFADVLRAIIETNRVVATCLPSHNREGNLPETSFEEAIAWCRLKHPDLGRLEWVLPAIKKEHIADFASRCGMKKGVRYLLVELGFKFKDDKPYPSSQDKSKRQLERELTEKKNSILLNAIARGIYTTDGLVAALEENGISVPPQTATKCANKLAEEGLIVVGKSTQKRTSRKHRFFPAGKLPEGYELVTITKGATAGKPKAKYVPPKKPKCTPQEVLKLRIETIKKAIESGSHRTTEIRSALYVQGQDITEARCYQILIELVEQGVIHCCKLSRAFYYYLPGQPIPLYPSNESVKEAQEALGNEVLKMYQQSLQKEAS